MSARSTTRAALALLLVACGEPSAPRAPATSGSIAASDASALASGSAAPAASAAASSSATAALEVPPVPPPNPPVTLTKGGKEVVRSTHGLVVSVEANASRAGAAVLESGGNAVDAAVATAYALAVTHPSAGNLGGGGFMIVRLASGESYAIDFRETAPAASTTKKVVDEVAAGAFGYASMVVPGTVAGLDLARDRFGTKPLATLVAPAIKLAKGHKLSARAAGSLRAQWELLKSDPGAKAIWSGKKGPLTAGEQVVQKDLAKTLKAIADHGDEGFYRGPVADAIVLAMKKNHGDITAEDLSSYKAKLREPLRFTYRGFTIETMPPPSMGGVAVAETLLQLERQGAEKLPKDDVRSYHLFIESAKRSYADRRGVGADPDFYGDLVPAGELERLLSGRHLTTRTPVFDPNKATPATDFPGVTHGKESPETTHFSVVDARGNAVSCTVTLSAAFGSKVVVPGTGVFFSNALGAFSPSGSNAVQPHKRMASSMSPTILSRNGKVEVVIGSPGGDTIPNTVAQVIHDIVDFGMPIDEAVKRGRVHHQLVPDQVRIELGREPSDEVKKGLEKLGHKLVPSSNPIGDVKVILRDPSNGEAWGFSDPREGGAAVAAKR